MKSHPRLVAAAIALVAVVITLRVRVPITRVQMQLTVRGLRYGGPVPVTLNYHATRCILFVNCWMDVLERRVETRLVDADGDRVTVDAVPLRYFSLGAEHLESIEIGGGPMRVSLAPQNSRPSEQPGEDQGRGADNPLDNATREGDVAVLRRHVYFLPSTIYFYAPGVRSVRVELDAAALPVARFALRSQGWDGLVHAASRSRSDGRASATLTIPAGAALSLPFSTGIAPREWPEAPGLLPPSTPDAVTGFVLVDEPTWRGVLGWKTTFRPKIPMSRADWDALRRRADTGSDVQVSLAADGTALRVTTRPGITARRYLLLASFRPDDALASADVLTLDVRP